MADGPSRVNASQRSTSSPQRAGSGRRALALIVGVTTALVGTSPSVVDAGSAPAARRSCATASAATYTVAAGNSWFGVATASGVTTGSLLAANDAEPSTVLHPGDVLCLPAGVTSSKPAASTTPAIATQAAVARSCGSRRTVAAGESWYVISRATGVPIDALVAANDAKTSSPIHPGQRLCLPDVGFGRDLPSVRLDAAPVRGACRFANSWQATRGGGRVHVGVDLIAPSGTPVVAAVNGTLTRQTNGAPSSGNAWWLTTSTGTYYFYAHLSRFAKGLKVGSQVQAGDVIGYVGSTGNAVSPHLHFEIHPNGGNPVNPYSEIWMVGGCTYDRRYEQTPLS